MCKPGFNCVALSRCDHFAVNQNNSQHPGKIATSISSTTSRRSVLHCDWDWDNQIRSEVVQKHIWHSSALLQHWSTTIPSDVGCKHKYSIYVSYKFCINLCMYFEYAVWARSVGGTLVVM